MIIATSSSNPFTLAASILLAGLCGVGGGATLRAQPTSQAAEDVFESVEVDQVADVSLLNHSASSSMQSTLFDLGYDSGIFVRLEQGDDSFELKTNIRTQFRVASFNRHKATFTDSTGIVRPIDNRQNLELERFRLIFSGHAFSPQFRYFMQADGDTDSRHVVAILDGWVSWQFSDVLELQLGKRKVPGSRNWMLGAFDTRLADRPFANEFFRPSRTTGIWLVSDPSSDTHYELMVGQGYNTEGLTPADSGDDFSVAGTWWKDIVGSYGPGRPSDFEFHEEFAVRIGASVVGSNEGTPGRQLEEADFLRLTDGTRLTETGALAPGATVESFKVALVAVDAAFKYRGWSANGECFWRSVTDLVADLPVPGVGLQHGGYVEGGFYVLPQQLELNSQFAFVTGRPGSANSYATGFSYYPRQTQYMKLSLDVTYIDGSPVNSSGSDILLGNTGILVRAQYQALF